VAKKASAPKNTEKAGRQGDIAINIGTANAKQAEFFQSRCLYTCYGGARGGGKSWAIRAKAVGGAVTWPGIRILIIRRTYPELQQNHIEPIIKMVPQTVGAYNGSLRTMYFTNGSFIKFGHAQSMSAIETEYQGQEYDWIFLDEATQFTEMEFRTLGGCLRGVNEIPKRFYLTCNPGGVGHRWVKRLFIDRDFKQGSSNPEENENPEDYCFIFARVDDNTALMNSKGGEAYKQMLSALPEKLRQAHRYGDWNALSGCYFDEFSEAKHVCEPFVIPDNWLRYRSFDYGLDMFACYWIAVEPETGRSYVYREFCKSNLIVGDAARAVHENTLPQEKVSITFAPPDMWNRQKDTGKSMAELFMLNEVSIVKSDNNRVQGHLQIKEMLADLPDGKPGLMFFPNCKRVIGDLQSIQADENNPSDCAKNPHDITHTVDGIRYYCISRVLASEAAVSQAADDDEDDEDTEDYGSYMCGGAASASYIGAA
jgi:phage terminase large subunit